METRHVARVRDEAKGNAANRRVECLRALFKWAMSQGHASRNPAKQPEFVRVVSEGYRAWTRDNILALDRRHPVGTKARLALALFLYPGQRRSDVLQLGPLNVRGNRLVHLQHKGRGIKGRVIKPNRRDIPLVPPLRAVLDASPLGKITFLETAYGKPFTQASTTGSATAPAKPGWKDCQRTGSESRSASWRLNAGVQRIRLWRPTATTPSTKPNATRAGQPDQTRERGFFAGLWRRWVNRKCRTRLSHLRNPDRTNILDEEMVAEEGLEPPTRGL